MTSLTFPPVVYNKYVWKQDPTDPLRYFRNACGGEYFEDILNRFNKGEQKLFLNVELRLESAVGTSDFVNAVRDAWVSLRRAIPTIAAHLEYTAAGDVLLAYYAPKDDAAVRAWAERTVLLERAADMDELRFEIGQKPLPGAHGDLTFVHVVPFSETTYGLLFYLHHTPFDGAGSKDVMSALLGNLARYLADPALARSEGAAWGDEAERLLPATSEVLAPFEEREGPVYTQALGSTLGQIASCMPRMYGLKQRNVGPGPTRRLGYKFSAEESTALVTKSRELGFTISQIAHAAVFLLTTKDNPPIADTPSDAVLMNYGLVNSRSRLKAPYNERHAYPGYCLGLVPLQVPVSLVTSNADKSDADVLLLLAGALKQQYALVKTTPSLLAIAPQMGELMMQPYLTGLPLPPWLAPWYSGDGIGEATLDPEYEYQGKKVLTITNFVQSLNKTDPGPFFRTWSWAGQLNLSADFNEYAMPRDVVQGFVDQWAELIRLIL